MPLVARASTIRKLRSRCEVIATEQWEYRGTLLQLETVLTEQVPPPELVTTGFCLAFDRRERFLMVRLVDRDWHPPGGHRDRGETPQQAATRETAEESGCQVSDLAPIGIQKITALSDPPPDWPYPIPAGYQVFFSAHVSEVVPCAGHEAVEAALLTEDEARMTDWVIRNTGLYDTALQSRRRTS